MFDWSDLFLLLPAKVFWTLFAVLGVIVLAVIVWAKYS